jgi:hypothetical protein
VQRSSKNVRGSVVRDWKPVLGAMTDVIDWALDIAVALAKGIEEDQAAIEKVRASFHAWMGGRPTEIEVSDLLVTFGTILAAIEIDLDIDSSAVIAPLEAMADAVPVVRFPGVERSATETVVTRKCPGARARTAHRLVA